MPRINSLSKDRAVLILLLIVGLFLMEPALGQRKPIDRLRGTWTGKGRLFGAEATFSMVWRTVLEGKFMRLIFENRVPVAGGGDRVLKAQAFYRTLEDGSIEGTWFDSRGQVLPLKGSFEENKFTVLWGSAETEQGRTVYEKLDRKNLMVSDYVLKDGEWEKFGSAHYILERPKPGAKTDSEKTP